MSKTFIFFLSISFLFFSCKPISFVNNKTTINPITLGSVGQDDSSLLKHHFNTVAIPNYKTPIKVMVTQKSFTKSTYKQYVKANASQFKPLEMILDSTVQYPRYIQLSITDKVTLVNALNAKANSDIKSYLSHHTSADIITKIAIALEDKWVKQLVEAQEVFLEQHGNKSHVIKTYTDNKETAIIRFSDGVVFAYKSSNSCWKEDKYQLNIIDLVDPLKPCPKKTYRSAKRAKSTINYFKL